MMKKWYKKVLIYVMTFMLFMMPAHSAAAMEERSLLTSLFEIPNKADINSNSNTLEKFEADSILPETSLTAKETAEKKATALTTFYNTSSVQYALIDNGTITLSGQAGYNDRASKKAPTKNTIYGIGSISKIFTTASILKLVDEGKVHLDLPVTNYIPEFTMADSRYKKITVRMLLNHSSGLLGSTFDNALLLGDNDHSSYDNFLKSLSTQPLKADPGAFSVYCNDGFTLAEIIVERVTGMTFTEYLSEKIKRPLQLINTKTPLDAFDKTQLANIYSISGGSPLPYESLMMIGAGGIYSTAEDLCYFAQSFMKTSNELLSYSSQLAMEKNEASNGLWVDSNIMSGYGLGWDNVNAYPFDGYNIKALTKNGDLNYYHGGFIVLPEYDMAVAVLSSGGTSTYNQIMAQEILLAALKEKGIIKEIHPPKKSEKPVKAIMPKSYEALSGIYANFLTYYDIQIQNDTLELSIPNFSNKKNTFIYTADDCFVSEDGKTSIEIRTMTNGNTYLLSKGYGSLVSMGEQFSYLYEAQKISPKTLDSNVQEAWNNRNNKKYRCVSEKYSSYLYSSVCPVAQIQLDNPLKGYIGPLKIMDEASFMTDLQIPMQYGRDLKNGHFFMKNGVEYLKLGQTVYISENGISNLSAKQKFTVTLGNSGYARYYKITERNAGKTITITPPKDSVFVIMDSNGIVNSNYHINKKTTVKLPNEGYLLFQGNAKAIFTVEYQ